MGEEHVGRIRFMDQQRVNLDGFAHEDAGLGLVAMNAPDDPEPSIRIEDGRVVEMDGTAEADFRNQNIALDNAHTQAKNERERAETLVRFLLLDLQNELRSTGRPDLVHKVASEALTFFDSLKDQQISTDTLYNRCIAYQQIANVLTEQGRRNEAETAFTRALEQGTTV